MTPRPRTALSRLLRRTVPTPVTSALRRYRDTSAANAPASAVRDSGPSADERLRRYEARTKELLELLTDAQARAAQHEGTLAEAQAQLADAVAERDAARKEVRRLRNHVAIWQRRIKSPSFLRHHHAWVDLGKHYRQDPSPAKERIGELNRKLWVHAYAASHGVALPTIYALAERPEDVDLSRLPDEFVVKSDGGTASKAVLPLRRVGEDRYEWISHDPPRTLSTTEVVEHFQAARAAGASYGPVFAEQLLRPLHGEGLPDDVKIYVAYGKVLHVLLRRPQIIDGRPVTTTRYVDDKGVSLGKVALWGQHSEDIPVPEQLDQMLAVAVRLSLSLPMPLCRVDMYETPDGPVLGEITRTPGAPHFYREDHDLFLGNEWTKAEARLFEDMHQGRSGRPLWGPHADLSMIDDIPGFDAPQA
ncbi:ATP-grasp fold amidoligase family protein [Micrococcus lylae]|uniref:ATP-grasp fold amidoligase family protein n=1 Tax=Micrococcus lylae TaxID=1273 RepID=UPI000C7FD4D4|nr:ATP-grasp fold amidoligase family protein [Micrococcus lylae]WIK83070.1 ATP-grasp fold amidoligase family protein [Micrococcus lylae]